MLPRPESANNQHVQSAAARRAPLVQVVARDGAAAAQICAMAPSGRLALSQDCDGTPDAVLIEGAGLRAEDRMWVRGQIGALKAAPIIVIGDNVSDEIACELIAAGAADVLDWATLTSTGLSRAVHLALARGAQFSNQISPTPSKTDSPMTLLQECASAIIMVDPDGVVKFANRDAEEMLGVAPGSLTGQPFALALSGEGKKEITLDGPNGRAVKAEMRIVDTKHGDVPMRVVTLQDVTLRRLLEKHFAA